MTATLSRPTPMFLPKRAWQIRWSHPGLARHLCQHSLSQLDKDSQRELLPSAMAHLTIGWLDKWSGRFTAATHHLNEATELFLKAGDHSMLPMIYSTQAIIAFDRNDFVASEDLVNKGLDVLNAQTAIEAALDLMSTHGAILRTQGKFDEGSHQLLKARDHAYGLELVRIQLNLAKFGESFGAADTAIKYSLAATAGAHKTGNRVILPYIHEVHALLLCQHKQWEVAERYLADGLGYAARLGDKRALSQLNLAQAMVAETRGNISDAQDLREKTYAFAQARGLHWVAAAAGVPGHQLK